MERRPAPARRRRAPCHSNSGLVQLVRRRQDVSPEEVAALSPLAGPADAVGPPHRLLADLQGLVAGMQSASLRQLAMGCKASEIKCAPGRQGV